MVRIAGINADDMTNGEGVCVSVFFQGCPHHCKGCHNPETWNFDGGEEIEYKELEEKILKAIGANGIQRNLSLSGGDPLYMPNLEYATRLAAAAKQKYPNIKIYCWTGFTLEQLLLRYGESILENIDVLIDGPFVLEKRDITLKLRGSSNQRVLRKSVDFLKK